MLDVRNQLRESSKSSEKRRQARGGLMSAASLPQTAEASAGGSAASDAIDHDPANSRVGDASNAAPDGRARSATSRTHGSVLSSANGTKPSAEAADGAAEQNPADIAIAGEVGRGLSALFRVAGRAKTKMIPYGPGIEWSTFGVLIPLMECGPLRSSALAEAVHLDPSRVSRMVSHMIELGLVARHADPADGRAAILQITAEGERLFHQIQRQRDEYLASVVSDWSEHDRRSLALLLRRLADGLGDAMQKDDHHTHSHSKLEPA
jgi:DNA-binding MarR family transcriptional regulator